MVGDQRDDDYGKWGRFRFMVVGRLLAAPQPRGELKRAIEDLAATDWVHPISGAPVRFGASTIERWYYDARQAGVDPVGALQRRVRSDAGTHRSVSEELGGLIEQQYRAHRRWSYKLHYDNLAATLRAESERAVALPSYSSVRRYMRAKGYLRAKGRRVPDTLGGARAAQRFEDREVRGFEVSHVAALYHADFHTCSRALVAPDGTWKKPQLFGCLCDRSRLVCHLQWYWTESARTLAHGLQQAFMKRGLPRGLMTDRGAAELATEIEEGLERLGVQHEPTLPYSPYQNAKQEAFWSSVEGRLLPMLEGVEDLTLDLLNEATQAWVEHDYNREVHSEIAMTPIQRWLEGPTVVRDSPGPEELRDAFRRTAPRRQRRSDGTLALAGHRFEVPSRYGHLEQLAVRYARWDLRRVHLVDARTGAALCRIFPQDKEKNATGERSVRGGPAVSERGTPLSPPASGMAPLLREYLEDYSASGLPAAYLPLDEGTPSSLAARAEERPQ
jgi:transposase InsO family protein